MGRREEAKNHRRQRIVAAAKTLMIEAGEAGFSMRALAKTAGVSIATPYNLFGSKQAILGSVFENDLANYQAELHQHDTDAIAKIFGAIAVAIELFQQEPEFYKAILSAAYNDRSSELTPFYNGPRHCLWKDMVKQAVTEGVLIKGTDPDAFAINLRYGFLASIMRWVFGKLSLEELKARAEYSFALSLSAMSTESMRPKMQLKIQTSQQQLQTIWQDRIQKLMAKGNLDKNSAELAADQIQLINQQEALGAELYKSNSSSVTSATSIYASASE